MSQGSENIVGTAFDGLQTPVAVVGSDGTIVAVSDAWRQFDVPGALPTGRGPGDAVDRADTGEETENLQQACESVELVLAGEGRDREVTYTCPQPDGRPRRFTLRVRGIDLGSERSAVIEHAEVTTCHHRSQALEHRTETLDTLATIVGHDIRNPLAALRGWTELLEADAGPEDDAKARILASIHRIEEIIDDAVFLARSVDVDEFTPVALEPLVRDVWAEFDQPSSSLTVTQTQEPILADPELLRTLVENLLGNARHHGGGTVTVESGPDGFSVADDGSGIDPVMRDEIFEPGMSTLSSPEHTGMGLTIVERIVDAHGWTIAVRDTETGGACFEIRDVRRGGSHRE